MPPSGYLYAYPGQMPSDVQANFVAETESAARLLSTNAAVAWEFALTWEHALDSYFPRYDAAGVVEALFAVDVPFMIPAFVFGDHFFKLVGNHSRVAVFRPREWRGSNPHGAPPLSGRQYLTPQQMADEVNSYPPGTVTQIYLTSDGGGNLDMLYSLVSLLNEHVEVVNHKALAQMAFASAQHQTR